MCYHRSLIDRFIYVGIWILAAMMFAIPASAAERVHRKTVHSNSPFWLRLVGGFTGLIYPSVTTHSRLDMSPFRRARRTLFRAFCVPLASPGP